jgi:hypothetical protein
MPRKRKATRASAENWKGSGEGSLSVAKRARVDENGADLEKEVPAVASVNTLLHFFTL